MNLINVETSKKFWKFQDIKDSDESNMAQKSFNVGETQLKLPKWLEQCKINSSIPWYSIQGSVLGGEYYQEHLRNKGLVRPLNKLLDDFNRGYISTNVLHERATGEILSTQMSNEVLELHDMEFERLREGNPNYTVVTRSANGVREDEAMQNVSSEEQFADLASKVGAGKHSTYANHNTLAKFCNGTLKVWASTFSFAACDDFKGLRSGDEWIHAICKMDVIWMHQIHSQKCASFIGFGNILGSGFNLSIFPELYGEEGVSGAATGVDLFINGNLLGSDAAVMSKSQKLDVPNSWWESTGRIMDYIQRTKGYIVDVEGAIGYKDPTDPSSLVITLPQQRANLPVEIKKASPFLEQHFVKNYPDAPLLFSGVCLPDFKCGGGKLVEITEESQIRTTDPVGNIFFTQESYPTLTGVKKQLAGSIALKGGITCHWAIQANGTVAYVTSVVQQIEVVPFGEFVTILKDRVYLGDHNDCWDILKIDLRDVQLPKSIVPKLVFGDPNSIDQVYPLFKWNLVKDFALCRWEEIFWSIDLPSILDWLNYDKIDVNSEGGRVSKAKIQTVMDSYGISDPVEAYIQRFVAGVVPLAELCKQFGGEFSLRLYGARMDEDQPSLVQGSIPFPESNPQYGYNGTPMYLTNWGSSVYDVCVEVLKRLYALGYTNIPLFIPNLGTPEELEILLQRAVDLGFDLTNVVIKPMLENQMAYYNASRFDKVISKFSRVPRKPKSAGWNDTTQNGNGAAIRVLPTLAGGRSSANNDAWEEIAYDSTVRVVQAGGLFESCGVAPEAIMKGMFRGGATACGLPLGKSFIDGLALFCKLEEENSQNS